MKVAAIVLAVLSMQACAGHERAPHHPQYSPGASIRAGRYKLVMSLDVDDDRPITAQGSLWLEAVSIGERACDHARSQQVSMVGSTDLDFSLMHAPVAMKGDEQAPPPSSTDPVQPGVVVVRVDDSRGSYRALLIGTVSNRLDCKLALDGTGIELVIEAINGNTIKGTWSGYGIAAGGPGTWQATLEAAARSRAAQSPDDQRSQ